MLPILITATIHLPVQSGAVDGIKHRINLRCRKGLQVQVAVQPAEVHPAGPVGEGVVVGRTAGGIGVGIGIGVCVCVSIGGGAHEANWSLRR